MTLVVGTAGHIDHGKTALLRALTGIDADRLPEERRRGMTIDVGYAHLDLPDGGAIDFVDVPGHDRLVGNMLVGAGEIDAALLVVAADDGPRAQTLEHLELLDGLAIRRGIAVITKRDLVDAERLDRVAAEVRALVDRTSLAGSAVVAASSVTGEGIEEVRAATLALRPTPEPVPDSSRGARLAIDRVFAVRGRGRVVTGSLRRGWLARGDELRVVPGDGRVRIREIQVHGRTVDQAGPGRVALNLAGAATGSLRRGAVLTTDTSVVATDLVLVALAPVAPLGQGIAALPHDRARARLHLGTDQVGATIGRSGSVAAALPTGEATAILRLERAAAVATGDRFVLRRPSPGRAEAGGRILDPAPPRGASRRRLEPERLAALAEAATEAARDAARLALHGAIVGPEAVMVADDLAERLRTAARAAVADHHAADPASSGIAVTALRSRLVTELRRGAHIDRVPAARAAEAILDRLIEEGHLERAGEVVRVPGRPAPSADPEDDAAMGRLEALLDVPAPPPLAQAARSAGCPPSGVRALERQGRIVVADDDVAWSARAWHRLATTALELAARQPLTPAALRDATQTSRRYVMPLLADLDRRQILRRTPDGHLPGPRAASLARPLATAGR